MSQPLSTESKSPNCPIKRKQTGLPALGLAIAAAKRGKHSFVMLSLEVAQEIHAVTKEIHSKQYKRQYNRVRYTRLKAKV